MLWYFLECYPKQPGEQTIEMPVIWDTNVTGRFDDVTFRFNIPSFSWFPGNGHIRLKRCVLGLVVYTVLSCPATSSENKTNDSIAQPGRLCLTEIHSVRLLVFPSKVHATLYDCNLTVISAVSAETPPVWLRKQTIDARLNDLITHIVIGWPPSPLGNVTQSWPLCLSS